MNGVLCVGCACDKQSGVTFQSPRLTGVRLFAAITLIREGSRSQCPLCSVAAANTAAVGHICVARIIRI